MNFSSIRKSSWLGRLLRWPLRLLPPGMIVPVLQGPLRGARWIVGASTHGAWLGSYEMPMQRCFTEVVHTGDVVLDIGANAGFYTLLAARFTAPNGHVFAFEPLPANLEVLRRHMTLNQVTHVQIMPIALADQNGETFFRTAMNNSMGHLTSDGDLRVTVRSLDALLAEGTIPLPNVLKVDVEGAELRVLQGAKQLLSQAHPTIILATHGSQVRADCLQLLKEQGYQVRPLSPAEDEFLAIYDKI
jgi:FkbM family methyltransferase